MRMIVRSTESKNEFPKNKPWDFRIQLPKWLNLTGKWKIELVAFGVDRVVKDTFKNEIFVYSDICEMSLVGEKERPLLRRIYISETGNMIFEKSYEVPLRNQSFGYLHFEIMDKNQKPANFLFNESVVSLVFTRISND